MKKVMLFFVMMVAFLSGCWVRHMEPRAYMNWVRDEENGLLVSKEIGGYNFSLQYKPVEFEALLHFKNATLTKKQLDSATTSIKDMQFFTFCIKSPDKNDPVKSISADEADYNQRLNYLMFEMQNDFLLIDGTDTLSCLFYHYERNFNVAPENNILLGFEQSTSKITGNKTVMYHDKILETGPVLLTIQSTDITAIPELNLNN